MEILHKILLKIRISIHKLLNLKLYRRKVILYGIPELIHREKIYIESNVSINNGVFLHGAGGILIGENVTLSYGTTILSTGYDVDILINSDFKKVHKDKSVKIGRNVWVCANVTILPGVEIANNCIIAAGSVVNKNILDSGYLYAGVPAEKIKKL